MTKLTQEERQKKKAEKRIAELERLCFHHEARAEGLLAQSRMETAAMNEANRRLKEELEKSAKLRSELLATEKMLDIIRDQTVDLLVSVQKARRYSVTPQANGPVLP